MKTTTIIIAIVMVGWMAGQAGAEEPCATCPRPPTGMEKFKVGDAVKSSCEYNNDVSEPFQGIILSLSNCDFCVFSTKTLAEIAFVGKREQSSINTYWLRKMSPVRTLDCPRPEKPEPECRWEVRVWDLRNTKDKKTGDWEPFAVYLDRLFLKRQVCEEAK